MEVEKLDIILWTAREILNQLPKEDLKESERAEAKNWTIS